MAEKKRTFTCKACGGEHAGLICTKFTSIKIMPGPAKKAAMAPLLALPAPKPSKPKKTKKVKRTKKRADKPAEKPQAAETTAKTLDAATDKGADT